LIKIFRGVIIFIYWVSNTILGKSANSFFIKISEEICC